ncbi:hypothetical protein WJX72_009733 [[Myrmecia] bisecta]|uniref:DNA-(apurinic or apyrimidinic site) lyase n=1 Tax=[Myrmecia] bisecta TaxID=41462 RepID=A0AAW1PV03_9CHLO
MPSTLEQLSKATEADLRANGFGYRAKFITASVAALLEKPGGGSTWLQSLRTVPYAEASEALCTLMGIGPKTEAIPVDTHVWQLAIRYYTPNLKGKSLTKKEAVKRARRGKAAGAAADHDPALPSSLPVSDLKCRLVNFSGGQNVQPEPAPTLLLTMLGSPAA